MQISTGAADAADTPCSMARSNPGRPAASTRSFAFYAELAGWVFGLGGLVVCAAVLVPRLVARTANTQPAEPVRVVLADEPTWLPKADRRALELGVLKCLSGGPFDQAGLQAARDVAQRSGWFDRVTQVRRPDLSEVRVEGVWAVPFALVSDTAGEHLVDTKGRLLPRTYAAGQGPALLRIRGATGARPAECGTPWPGADLQAALEMAALMEGKPWCHQIAAIDVSTYAQDGVVRLRTDRGCELIWGRSPGQEGAAEVPALQKLAALQYLHDRLGRLDAGCEQALDLRSDVVRAR
jgi:hypothetical protein